jgi:hypothetical protein
MKYVTTTRLSLNKEERAIARTWGRDWSRLRNEQKKHGSFYILIGDWSGYRSGQYRYTHVVFMSRRAMKMYNIDADWSVYHVFGDSTGMRIWLQEMTIEELISSETQQRRGYDSLVDDYLSKARLATEADK